MLHQIVLDIISKNLPFNVVPDSKKSVFMLLSARLWILSPLWRQSPPPPPILASNVNCWKRSVDFAENCMTFDDKTKLYAAKTVEKDLNAKKTKTTFKNSFSNF